MSSVQNGLKRVVIPVPLNMTMLVSQFSSQVLNKTITFRTETGNSKSTKVAPASNSTMLNLMKTL